MVTSNTSSIKDRVSLFAKTKCKSVRSFETRCGLGNGFVRNIGNSISVDRLEKILNAFPELSREWLVNGSGEMLVQDNTPVETLSLNSDRRGVIVYDIDATCGADPRDIAFTEDTAVGFIDLPNVRRDCVIVRANGDSMTPVIKDGNWIAVREIYNFEDLFYGQIYLVLTDEYRIIKYVRRYEPDEDNFILLRSANKEYDDIRMHKSKIRKLFIVENILSVKIQL